MKYKKLTLVFLVILFLLIFNTFSFATYFEGDDNDHGYYYSTFPDELLEKVMDLDEWSSNDYGCFGFHYKAIDGYRVIFIENKDNNKTCYIDTSLGYGSREGIKLDSGNIIYYEFSSDFSFLGRNEVKIGHYTEDKGNDEYLFRNINAYDGDILFFLGAPLSTLALIVERTETQGILAQIVAILPLILVVVVSFLGLRKAWSLLSTLLHQA